MSKPETLMIDDQKYIREDKANTAKPNGHRAVIVVDRGWIFAGDVTEKNGRITLARAVWVFRWEGIGFDRMVAEPNNSKVQIRALETDVDLPLDAEIFRCPVHNEWGLK